MLSRVIGKAGPVFVYYGDYNDDYQVYSSVAVLYPELSFYHSFDEQYRSNPNKASIMVYRDFEDPSEYTETEVENESLQQWIHAQRYLKC
jgi:hypothetical protein